jgi:hypothetical protein
VCSSDLRRVGLSFEVAVNSKAELLSVWRKLNYLQGMCYPTAYPHNVSMTAPIMAITVGAILQRVFTVMNSVSFDFDGSTLWEIEKDANNNYQLPMMIKVSVDMNVLYDSLPITNARHFAQDQSWMDPILYEYTSNDIASNNAGTKDGLIGIQKNPQRKRVLKQNSYNSSPGIQQPVVYNPVPREPQPAAYNPVPREPQPTVYNPLQFLKK